MAGPGDNTRNKSKTGSEADSFKRAMTVCMRAISGDNGLEVAFAKERPALAGGKVRLPEPPRVCVTEVPLLYESGAERRFDKVVVITAPAKLREQRRRVRRDDRDERLLPDAEKVKRADYAYVNTGTPEELDEWVAGVMAELVA